MTYLPNIRFRCESSTDFARFLTYKRELGCPCSQFLKTERSSKSAKERINIRHKKQKNTPLASFGKLPLDFLPLLSKTFNQLNCLLIELNFTEKKTAVLF